MRADALSSWPHVFGLFVSCLHACAPLCTAPQCHKLCLPVIPVQHPFAGTQVFYRDDNVSIPLSLARSFLPSPSAVTYNLSAEAGTLKALPKQLRHGAISSADFGQGSEWELQLPVNWSAVPLEASYRWALDLQPAWLSQVTGNASNSTIAVHLFGVEEGQCPPGTIR